MNEDNNIKTLVKNPKLEKSTVGTDARRASQENSPEAVINSTMNPPVPPNSPKSTLSMPGNLNQNNMVSSPAPIQILPSSLQQTNAHQMDLYNSTMGLFGASQNQHGLPPTQFTRLSQGFENPYSMQPLPELLFSQQANYGYQPQQSAFYTPEPLPQPGPSNAQQSYQNPYSNLHHLDGHFSCPYGYNIIAPYPSLCDYCFPESQVEPIDYSMDESRTNAQRRQSRKRKGSESGGNGRKGLACSRNVTGRDPEDEANTDIPIDDMPIASRLRPRTTQVSFAESESSSSSSSSLSSYKSPTAKIRKKTSENENVSFNNDTPISQDLQGQGSAEPTFTDTEYSIHLNQDNYDNVPMDIDMDIH